jgi:hypothetical protein
MRQVALFYDAEEAQIVRGFLQSRGIDAQLPDEQALSVIPSLGFGLGGYRLMVPDRQHFQASALLAEVQAEAPSPACSHCGEGPLRRIRGWMLPALMTALFGLVAPFAPATARLRCAACGQVQPGGAGERDDEKEPAS